MRNPRRKAVTQLGLLIVAVSFGCAAYVENLRPGSVPSQFRPDRAYQLTVGVTGPAIRGPKASGGFEEGLADFLANEGIFQRVVYPFRDGRDQVDMLIRVKASGEFLPGGMKNFFTWFPGGLLFAPAFRGTRWHYDAAAEVEILEGETREPFAKYSANTSHVVIHRSAAPGPLTTALIVPAVISGSRSTRPRRPYTTLMFAAAFPDLWKQIGAQILAQDPNYLAAADRAQARAEALYARRYPPQAPPGSYRSDAYGNPQRGV